MARRGRLLPDLRDFGPLGRCTHIGAGARRDRFSTIDKRGRRCLREPAHGLGSGRERWRDGAGCYRTFGISAPSVVARILARARDATDFRPSINGVGGACASRRTVWGSGRERWRDGAGCYRTFGISAPSVVARILARARDATDFRPSINGVGGACASRRTVWESGRERWRDGAGCYRTSGFRPPRSLHAYWRGRATRPIFDHR
jgi:sarcosine oxidase delta subunit